MKAIKLHNNNVKNKTPQHKTNNFNKHTNIQEFSNEHCKDDDGSNFSVAKSSDDEASDTSSPKFSDDEDFDDNDGWIDDEAMEDNEMEESEVDENRETDEESEHEIAFQAGGSAACRREILKSGQLNRIDDFSSNSEDDGDLSDFVVDDDEFQYTSDSYEELPDCENLSSSDCQKEQKVSSRKRKHVIESSEDEKKCGSNTDDSEEHDFFLNDRPHKRIKYINDSSLQSIESKDSKSNNSDNEFDNSNSINSTNNITSDLKSRNHINRKTLKKRKATIISSEDDNDSDCDISTKRDKPYLHTTTNTEDDTDSCNHKSTKNLERTKNKIDQRSDITDEFNENKENSKAMESTNKICSDYSDLSINDINESEECSIQLSDYIELFQKMEFTDFPKDFLVLSSEKHDSSNSNLEDFSKLYKRLENMMHTTNYKAAVKYLVYLLKEQLQSQKQTEVYAILIALLMRNISLKIGIDVWISLLAITSGKDNNHILNLLSYMMVLFNLKIIKTSFLITAFKLYLQDHIQIKGCFLESTLSFLKCKLESDCVYYISQDFCRGETTDVQVLDSNKECQDFILRLLIQDSETHDKIKTYYNTFAGKPTVDYKSKTLGKGSTANLNQRLLPQDLTQDLIHLSEGMFTKKFINCNRKLILFRVRRMFRESFKSTINDLRIMINYGQECLLFKHFVKQVIETNVGLEEVIKLFLEFCKNNDECKGYIKHIFWEHFLELESFTFSELEMMSKFLFYLIKNRCFNLTALKKMDFAQQGKVQNLFYDIMFNLLYDPPKEKVLFNIFKLTLTSKKHNKFKKNLKDFLSSSFTKKNLPKHQRKRINPTLNLVLNWFNKD